MIWLLWIGFIALVLVLLALDLGVFNRKPHAVSATEALAWTGFWVALALVFNALVYLMYDQHWFGIGQTHGHALSGGQAAIQFFTAYVVEKSLSLDNIFVIALIFAYFKVPAKYQHRVLYWGIVGALIMRGAMIAAGLAMIELFSWVIYGFGALLLITAARMLIARQDELAPQHNPLVRWVTRWIPVTEGYREERFFVREAGKLAITPLCLTLLLVESSDVLFAIDSIPAVFAVTRDPFIVFTSNVFAILGLRSLYFALGAILHRFRYLKISLAALLGFIGIKMLVSHHYPIPASVSLAMIAGILMVGALASVLGGTTETMLEPAQGGEPQQQAAATCRYVRRLFAIAAGLTLAFMSTALLLTIGPGPVIVAGGLTLVLMEFVWARAYIAKQWKKAGALT